jgi:eukaryotic-like serine/threonine-protein kinase
MGDQGGGGAIDGLPCIGETFAGKYQVERILGSGAMGVVVAARHLELDPPVAIKFMRPGVAVSGDAISRFIREARAAARIQSEHVVRIHDVCRQEGGAPYMVMEYLLGSDLDQIVRARGPMRIEAAVEYIGSSSKRMGRC